MSATSDAFRARINRLRNQFKAPHSPPSGALADVVREAPSQLDWAERLLSSRDPAVRAEIRVLLMQLEMAARVLKSSWSPE